MGLKPALVSTPASLEISTLAVTYSLLLDGDPVLDHLPGEAELVDGRWLVSLRTYCDVSTQGAEVIPEPCR